MIGFISMANYCDFSCFLIFISVFASFPAFFPLHSIFPQFSPNFPLISRKAAKTDIIQRLFFPAETVNGPFIGLFIVISGLNKSEVPKKPIEKKKGLP